jgi:hypothetical protein
VRNEKVLAIDLAMHKKQQKRKVAVNRESRKLEGGLIKNK